MSAVLKLIAGLIVFLIGIYWYLPDNFIKQSHWVPLTVGSTFQAFLVVFFGLFGLALIFVGLLVMWIEIEDMRWARREKAEKAAAPAPAPAKKK